MRSYAITKPLSLWQQVARLITNHGDIEDTALKTLEQDIQQLTADDEYRSSAEPGFEVKPEPLPTHLSVSPKDPHIIMGKSSALMVNEENIAFGLIPEGGGDAMFRVMPLTNLRRLLERVAIDHPEVLEEGIEA